MPPELAQYGLPGLIIFTLCGVIIWYQKRVDKLQVDKDSLQEKRLNDIIAMDNKYTQVMDGFSQTSSLLLAKLEGKGQ